MMLQGLVIQMFHVYQIFCVTMYFNTKGETDYKGVYHSIITLSTLTQVYV